MHVGVVVSMKKGLDLFVYRELRVLAAQGFAVSLFPTKLSQGLYNPDKDWRVYRWQPLRVMLLQPLLFLRQPLRCIRVLREAIAERALVEFVLACYFASKMAGIDVLYAICGDQKLFVAYFCRQLLGRPLAVVIHAYELYRNPNPHLFAKALAACDQIITVTDYNKELLVERFGASPDKVRVVRITVDIEDYTPAEKFVILIVSFFDERKGHEVLFRAIKELDQEDLEVWVVGGDDRRPGTVDVRGMAVQLGVDSQVAFFGQLGGNALKAVYRACDLFCLPCRTDSRGIAEGFPTVLAEAMAFGKPVITTRHVEIPRIVEEIVVDENDVHGLAEAIQELYLSRSRRQELGERNRRIAERTFSVENAKRTAAILTALADQRADRIGLA